MCDAAGFALKRWTRYSEERKGSNKIGNASQTRIDLAMLRKNIHLCKFVQSLNHLVLKRKRGKKRK